MSEKKWLLDSRKDVSVDEIFDGRSFDEAIQCLRSIEAGLARRMAVPGIEYDVRFKTDHWGYDGGMDLCVEVYRRETDQEFAERLAEEAEKAAARKAKNERRKARADERARKQLLATEADERALLEQLKKKYESS